MSSIELIPAFETPSKHILETYGYPNFSRNPNQDKDEFAPDGFRIEVVAPTDYRVPASREIEVATFVALGDPEEEVRAEFLPYNDYSTYFLAFDKHGNREVEDIAAMGRVIPYNPRNSNKTLLDLAIIPGWDVPGIPLVTGHDNNFNEKTIHDTQSVMDAFRAEAHCPDITKVWDISTMAPAFDFVINKKMSAAKAAMSILGAISEYGITAHKNGKLTHVTSFNQKHAHEFFNKVGYPFNNMFGLGPMVYDSFGSEVGMEAQPAWFSVQEFADQVSMAETTSYLGKIATSLRARNIL